MAKEDTIEIEGKVLEIIQGLPVRGQRTNRNARTRKGKGKTVANKKKA